MTSGPDQVLDFRAAIEKNRQVFALQHAYAYYAFFGLTEAYDRVGRRLQSGRDAKGKSYVSLIPFLLIVQRQSMSAFEVLASYRSYESWVLLRPALEAALIMGKWVDDPENAAIWNSRGTRKTEYIKHFSGKGLISTSLPYAGALRSVLDRLNDEFVHANEPYYSRHTNAQAVSGDNILLRLEFFDDDGDLACHTLAFLHLCAVIADSLDEMLATILPSTGEPAPIGHALEVELQARAESVRGDAVHDRTLLELGLWPAAAV